MPPVSATKVMLACAAPTTTQGFPCSSNPGLAPWWLARRVLDCVVVISDDERTAVTSASTLTDGARVTATPTERILTGSLLVAPVIYLAADSTYAAQGWDSGTAGIIHVLGAIAYGLVVLRLASWLPATSRLAAAILVTGLIGLAGNVAYGFEAIHMSFGDTQLVDRAGSATLIKPLGLFFPLSFVLIAAALARLGRRWQAALVLAAMVGWPIAHIGDIAALAVIVNVALVVAFGSLAWPRAEIE
jgi:hypothetical protein